MMNRLISNPMMNVSMIVSLGAVIFGCSKAETDKQRAPQSPHVDSHTAKHSEEDHEPGSHSDHSEKSGHSDAMTIRRLKVVTEPSSPKSGEPTKLSLHIQNEDSTTIKTFDVIHEKLIHLIIVRDGLDEFAHLHPAVDASGAITQEYAFPKGGKYRLFADHQPQGKSPGVAAGEVTVAGSDEPAAPLKPTAPGDVTVDKITAHVGIIAGEQESTVRFQLVDATGRAIDDLQPYLGAMGHLVIISDNGREYVHAHPLGDAKSAPDGKVEFAAHFPRAGIFKAWGQFQRDGSVFTVPFVVEHKAAMQHKH